MLKFLWKSLIISPAVLGATLLVSMGALRAADSASLFAADSQTATKAAQPQTASAQTLEVPLLAKDATMTGLTTVATPTVTVEQDTPVHSAAATQVPIEPTVAEVEVPAEVAVTQTQLNPASPNTKIPAPISGTPAADTTVAQVTPAAPSNTDALDQVNGYSDNADSLDQVTNVTQLSDVRPTDWAYEALRSLVERYGCIAGYPDRTFRGNRALTRFEFAAGLNACLNQVERLIAASTTDFVRRQDLETLQRLVREFQAELTTLGARVDKLEGRVGFLEDRQFSTTTKLSGEAIFALTDEFNLPVENNTVFQDRVRLTFNTSFTGRDRLATRLTAGNAQLFNLDNSNGFLGDPTFPAGSTALTEGQQTFNIGSTGNNSVAVDWLAYYFNFGSSKVYLAATGGIHSDYAPTLNPYFEDYDGGNGALSTFASESPIYRIGGGAGGAISLGVGPLESILGPSTLTVGYLAGAGNDVFGGGSLGANNPREKAGLYDGDYAILGQLNFNLGDRIGIGATYVHGYHNTGTPIFDLGVGNNNGSGSVVGSRFANNPGFAANLALPLTPVVTNSYGIEAAFRLTNNISISGFGAYTNAILIGQGSGDIWTYGGGVAFSDFGGEGNVLGLFAGVEPTLRGLSASVRPAEGFARDNSFHIEGFYKYKLTDNISVTPGVIWLTAPNQNDNNPDVVIGTLRTTFTF
ncbi:MAG TPA: iron uptake porin [Coleofasciculaceae cyanobacterium]